MTTDEPAPTPPLPTAARAAVRVAVRTADPAAALTALAAKHDPRALLVELAALQDGQYAVAQARALGLGPQVTRWWIDGGRAVRLAVGVARLRGVPGNADPAVTGFLRGWPCATVAGLSAAAHHGLVPDRPPRPHVLFPHGEHRRLSGVVLHQTRCLPPVDRVFVGAVAYTSLARTVCDLATLTDPASSLTRLDDAVAAGASPRWIHERATALTVGRDGVALIRDATDPSASATFRSWLERHVAQVLERAGLPPASWNVAVHDARGLIGTVDALWVPWRVVVEVEGLRFHTSPGSRRRDASRFNRLLAAGFAVRRFTWHDAVDDPRGTAVAVAEALREAGAPADPAAIPTDLGLTSP